MVTDALSGVIYASRGPSFHVIYTFPGNVECVPCSAAKPQVAQLMRVHVVTPKAPVHVTLNPRVQPGHAAPIFFPGNKEPVRLSQSAYWVLRLPFVYEGDAGPFLPPKDGVPIEGARLLSGIYGIVEQGPVR